MQLNSIQSNLNCPFNTQSHHSKTKYIHLVNDNQEICMSFGEYISVGDLVLPLSCCVLKIYYLTCCVRWLTNSSASTASSRYFTSFAWQHNKLLNGTNKHTKTRTQQGIFRHVYWNIFILQTEVSALIVLIQTFIGTDSGRKPKWQTTRRGLHFLPSIFLSQNSKLCIFKICTLNQCFTSVKNNLQQFL